MWTGWGLGLKGGGPEDSGIVFDDNETGPFGFLPLYVCKKKYNKIRSASTFNMNLGCAATFHKIWRISTFYKINFNISAGVAILTKRIYLI